jgi:HK97 family phage prohead protease
MVNRRELRDSPERRGIAASEFEFRSGSGNSLTLTGYASMFGNAYTVMGGPPFGWDEVVDQRAFDRTLAEKPDLHLLINHEGMPLARTKSGTLRLSADSRGLLVEADLDQRDPDVQRLATKMERGDMDEMSFAFRVKDDKWNDDETRRTLTEVSLHKGDVSVVNWGANPATSASIRSMREVLDALAEAELDQALTELRAAGDDVLARVEAARDVLRNLYRSLRPGPSRRLTVAALRELEDETELPTS